MPGEYKKNGAAVPAALPDRPQPHADSVEKAVLAALLRDPSAELLDSVRGLFKDRAVFYNPAHREIYATICELGKEDIKNVDLLSVVQRLREKNKLDAVGGEVYLAELEMAISTTVNLETWCNTLVKYDTLRQMITVCSESLLNCYDAEKDVDSLMDEIENKIFQIRGEDASAKIVAVKSLVRKEFEELIKIQNGEVETGLKTGYSIVDEYTGGLKPGEMFILAARPSIGKTSLALNILSNIGIHGVDGKPPVPCAFFSLEMTEQQIVRRLLCGEANVPESVFWNHQMGDAEFNRLQAAAGVLNKAKIFIDPTGGLSIAELRAKARRLKMKEKIQLVVIDYIGLMNADERLDSRQAEIQKISGAIKTLAKDLKIPFLVLAQLNREVDKNASANSKPKLANLRDSGAIEQDADVVTFLHRDREKSKGDVPSAEALWIIEKNRNGKTGDIRLVFYPSRMQFQLAAPIDQQMGPQ